MKVHDAIAEAETATPARIAQLTLDDFQRWIQDLAAVIGADERDLPTFGTSEDGARPHIAIADGCFEYLIIERGVEIDRLATDLPGEILARTFIDITATMASRWETIHRNANEDSRRRMFAKQLDLLTALHPPWAQRRAHELATQLHEAALDPAHAAGVVALVEHPPHIRSPKGPRLYNVRRKVQARSDRLDFAPDEKVIAAAMTFPAGHKTSSAIRMGAGGIAIMPRDAPGTPGAAAQMPGGQHFLAITDRRLIATTVTSWSTMPKELVAEWPLELVRSIDAKPGFMAATISVRFRDGSAFQLDGARSSGAEELEQLFG